MAQVNHPSNIMDRMVRMEQELAEVRKKVGLSSATISRGGLTVQEGGYIRVTDPEGDELFYVGGYGGQYARPDGSPQQATVIRDDQGHSRFYIWDPNPDSGGYRQYVAILDYSGNIVLSDDVDSGHGLARPWLPVPLYPLFVSGTNDGTTGELIAYASIGSAELSGETILWEGRASVSHPFITVDGTWGRGSGDVSVTYRLKVDGSTVHSWSRSSLTVNQEGPADVSSMVGTDWAVVEITAQVDSGSGTVACQPYGCYLRQS